MPEVAYAILSYPKPSAYSAQDGIFTLKHSQEDWERHIVRFGFMPTVGMRLNYKELVYVVDDVVIEVAPSAVAEQLAAIACVSLTWVKGRLQGYAGQAQPGVLVRLLKEHLLEDEAYEGESIRLPALPREGDRLWDSRWGDGSAQHAYFVKKVHHILARGSDGLVEAEIQVIIARSEGPDSDHYRIPRPSSN
jgi:hypothetical protein